MVLPDTATSALILLFFSCLCFLVWPNLFKVAAPRWRFELFSMDFALGALAVAVLSAYTLGSRGSELDFGDSMLVAGRRAEVMALGAGAVFALANMLYLGTIALMGLSNATLLAFSVFGCGVGLLGLSHGRYLLSGAAVALLALAALSAVAAARAARPPARPAANSRSDRKLPMAPSTKGAITGVLAGLSFAAIWPVLSFAQTEQFGIGAYGGTLMAALGVVGATFLLNFFFMNISLEGGSISYGHYLAGSLPTHLLAGACGAIWTAGALALYAAKTGNAGLSTFDGWLVPFVSGFLIILSGIIFWQRMQLTVGAKRIKWLALLLFTLGAAVLMTTFPR